MSELSALAQRNTNEGEKDKQFQIISEIVNAIVSLVLSQLFWSLVILKKGMCFSLGAVSRFLFRCFPLKSPSCSQTTQRVTLHLESLDTMKDQRQHYIPIILSSARELETLVHFNVLKEWISTIDVSIVIQRLIPQLVVKCNFNHVDISL